MSDLRDKCIKAMAVNDHPDLLIVAEEDLDRLLDVLTEHRKEWLNETGPLPSALGLLTVLRRDTEDEA